MDMRQHSGFGAIGGGGRAAWGVEVKSLEAWRDAHMNSAEFSHGNVWSMFRRIYQTVG